MPLTIEWSEEEIRALIDERRRRNADFYLMFGRSKVQFWNEVVDKIEEDTGTRFTGSQCSDKFKNLVRDCNVSKFLLKFILGDMYLIIYETLYRYEYNFYNHYLFFSCFIFLS